MHEPGTEVAEPEETHVGGTPDGEPETESPPVELPTPETPKTE